MANARKTELAVMGLMAASAGLFLMTYVCVALEEVDPPFILAQDASPGPLAGLFFGAVFLSAMTQDHFNHRHDNVPSKGSYIAVIGAAMVMMAACYVLHDGFGPEQTGDSWNQPSDDMEKSIFGIVWGGMLTASTVIFAWNGYKIRTDKPSNEGANKPLLT